MKRNKEKRELLLGLKPESGLKEVLKYTKKGIALDIGAGKGRNSIFLAKNGFKVEAVDKIKEGLEKCKRIAKKHNLPIKLILSDINEFEFKQNKYSLIIAIHTLTFLKFSEIKKLFKKIENALLAKGIVYLVVFSTKDPAFRKYKKKKLHLVEARTFYLPKLKIFRHFFTKRELITLLKNFKIIEINEEVKKDFHDKPHIHHLIKVIAKKSK